jgi:formimidoylglutamate deiminase
MSDGALLWAPSAWLPGGWQASVLLRAGSDGRWLEVTAGVTAPPQAQRLAGPVLPGMVDGHSHAFQRAFAGLAERREQAHDDFWSWRERLYRVALRIEPAQMQAIAAQLYVELMRGGYTHVCEFHYLQHRTDGTPYPDPLAMSWALADAGAQAGMPLTILPVLYERGGFDGVPLSAGQRRFRADASQVWSMQSQIAASRRPDLSAGLAIHSLRAASPAGIDRLRALADSFEGPIHVHVAEQVKEVEDALPTLGARPVEWLARQRGLLDPRWQLVHATHTVATEIEQVAASGAGIVLCPTTEANLGDGLADVPAWLDTAVPISIGSDSQVSRSWREELRLLEYGQRLQRRARNIGADPIGGEPSTAERLFARTLAGGARSAGFTRWGLQAGARADLLVIDRSDSSLLGIADEHLLDALVFSGPGRPWRDVMVAGHWRVTDHRHAGAAQVAERFEETMRQLWGESED